MTHPPVAPAIKLRGALIYPQQLDQIAQQSMVQDVRGIVRAAPLFSPQTPYGKPMSVRMTSAGKYGWFSDKTGYRYVSQHPMGTPWPDIPESILNVWRAVSGVDRLPDCCLINFYAPDARMGMHQDKDEADFKWPVVSISLGDDGLFRMGNSTRGGKTDSIWLRSGDVVVLQDEARLAYHGLDRLKAGTSTLLNNNGRVNLTLRVVD